jgi:hypothetical protein
VKSEPGTWGGSPGRNIGLVRGICGSLIRSNGAGKVGSRSRRTRCRSGVGFLS